jgi:hypothetical protein
VTDELADMAHDDVLVRIADAFEHGLDPIPERLTAAANAAFTWRLADEELAELLFDSMSDELVGVRGSSSGRRSFRYASGEFVIRVHLAEVSLVVMVEPPLSVACRVVTEQGVAAHRTDELGELVVDAPELPMRLEVDLPSGKVVTPWITG